ncbi:unnamed protein product, partial [Heterotrigona itama]
MFDVFPRLPRLYGIYSCFENVQAIKGISALNMRATSRTINTYALLILLWTLALANSTDLHVDSREVLTVYGRLASRCRPYNHRR